MFPLISVFPLEYMLVWKEAGEKPNLYYKFLGQNRLIFLFLLISMLSWLEEVLF